RRVTATGKSTGLLRIFESQQSGNRHQASRIRLFPILIPDLRHLVTTTRVPMLTRLYKSMMSSLYMRIQPCETKPPIVPGALVPWMAYSPPPERVMAAAPIGLRDE